MNTIPHTVEALLTAYFDGLYTSDASALAAVSHPRAVYFDTTSEPPIVLDDWGLRGMPMRELRAHR